MSVDICCDDCGRSMQKAHRIHKGRRYCVTCYSRVFKRRLCPKCGCYAQLPKDDPNAVCRKCEKAKPCVRCGKAEYEIGRITPYGPVCNACAPHFRKPDPCENCGGPSARLTRVVRLGGDKRLCPKCARADHGTCPACRRHRLLQEGPDGRMLCKACAELGEVPCPSCGKPMPAGRGKSCEACYWANAFRKRLAMDQAALAGRIIREAFGEFGEWLLAKVGSAKAAITIHRYLPFFMELDKRWNAIPSYQDLLQQFGAEGLRRVRLPMGWLSEMKGVTPDAEAREEDSERRRIDAILTSIPHGTLAAQALHGYRDELLKRLASGDTSIRSIRLAMRPAASLLTTSDASGHALPNKADLDKYLVNAPGQKAALTGFTNYLNRRYSLGLVPWVNERRVKATRKGKLEAEMMALIREANATGVDGVQRKWVSVALEYFHGLPRTGGTSVRDDQVAAEGDGLSVSLDGRKYWIPRFSINGKPSQ